MAACYCAYIVAPFVRRACLCVTCPSPSLAQMQSLRLRYPSQTSRRKLQFDKSKLGQSSFPAPTRKRPRTIVSKDFGTECAPNAYDCCSPQRERNQETGLPSFVATYRRRRSKQVQQIKDENLDRTQGLAYTTGRNGVARSSKGARTQNSKSVDGSPISEHHLLSGSTQKRVSRAVNGSSTRKYKRANAARGGQLSDDCSLAEANSGALNVVLEELSLPGPSIGVEFRDFNQEDAGRHAQSFEVKDVAPLAQYSSSLDIVPLHDGSLSHAVDTAILYQGPFPSFPRPSQEECSEVCDRLSRLHGPLEEYAKHKVVRTTEKQVLALEFHKEGDSKTIRDVLDGPSSSSAGSTDVSSSGHPRERRTVLDSLVGTMLSQNTTDTNSRRAFASLKAKFPTWESVYSADPKAVEDAIRCGGLAEIKTARILNILKALEQERGKLCLEYVRHMSVDEVKLELSRFKGVGPKTIACVLMFHLQQNEFPVDTHVFRITKMLGWVPEKADREKAYLHLNHRIPNHLKYDLHCLLVTHGKRCPRCAKGGRMQKPADGPCPLVNLKSMCIEASPCDLSIEP